MNHREAVAETLTPEVWERVSERLLCKLLGEFTREGLLTPTHTGARPIGDGDSSAQWERYRLCLCDGVAYRFDARPRAMGSYRVRRDSVRRRAADGEWRPATDPIEFLVDARSYLGTDEQTLARVLEEYYNTLVADAHQYVARRDRETSLVDLPYAEVEGELEGHPKYTYNKGRLGFDYADCRRHAPEAKRERRLSWLAGRRDRATFTAVDDLTESGLLASELGERYQAFRDQLADDGLDPDRYHVFPVHDYQWTDSVVQLFADDVAADALVPLGDGPDRYLPQQSIRTFSNVTDPRKHHVKLPIRVLNTNVYRGLLGEQARAAPAVTSFVTDVRDGDPFLASECDLALPGEVASVDYEHPTYSRLDDAPYQYHELLGCIWRESVPSRLEAGESPLQLAALLQTDPDGTPVVAELVERSGMDVAPWLEQFLSVLLDPILHYLYAYGTVFMPHGTNVVLVHEDGVPTRIAITDFVDEVAVADREYPELTEALPARLADDERFTHSICTRKPPVLLCHRIVGTLFDGVFRFLAEQVEREHDVSDQQFWGLVREAIEDYHARFPEYEERFEAIDLLRPRFRNYCLNRNRLLDHGYRDRSTRPKVRHHGTVPNPLVERV